MAELTGVPYSTIMLVAVFPALMYFFSVFVMVHYEAKRYGIRGEKASTGAGHIFKQGWFYSLPLVVITVLMLMGYSPGYSAIFGLITCIAVSWLRRDTRIGPQRFPGGRTRGSRKQSQDRRHRGRHRHHHRCVDLQWAGAHVRRYRDRVGRWQTLADHSAHRPGVVDPGHGRAGHRCLLDHPPWLPCLLSRNWASTLLRRT